MSADRLRNYSAKDLGKNLIKPKNAFRVIAAVAFIYSINTWDKKPDNSDPTILNNQIIVSKETLSSDIIFSTSEIAPTPTAEVKEESTLIDDLLQSFVDEVPKRREEKAKNDPDYYKRVDQKLNEGRVNFLLFGSGYSHEPPYDRLEIGSPSIISIDYRSGKIDIISLTHDIRDPLVEDALGIKGQKESAQRLDQSLLNVKAVEKVGKFKLPELSLENATGFAIDYQIHFKDDAMGRFVDALGGLEVDFPLKIPLQAYWYDGKKYEEKGWVLEQGPKKLSGREVVGAIKAIPTWEPPNPNYKPEMEHNFRKALVFKALQKVVQENLSDNSFKLKFASFLVGEMLKGQTDYDFNAMSLVVNNLLGKFKSEENKAHFKKIEISKSLYVVDKGNSVEKYTPVHWINPNSMGKEGEVFQKNMGYEMPIGGNPNSSNLVSDYWRPVRDWLYQEIMGQPRG